MLRDAPPVPPQPPPGRRRLLDNPRVLVGLAVGLAGLVAALFWLSESSIEIAPPVLIDVLAYPLLAANLTLLVALVFVLARNLLKVWGDRRRAVPFARYRAKLVAALLAMAIVPAALVLVSGSSIIRNSAARWFSEPVDEILSASQVIASRWYQERQQAIAVRAARLVPTLPASALPAGDDAPLDAAARAELSAMRDGLVEGAVEIYRVEAAPPGPPNVALVVAVESPSLAGNSVRASADRLAARVAASGQPETADDQLESGAALVRAGVPIALGDGAVVGVLVVSEHVRADLRGLARRASDAYTSYQSLRALRQPIQVIYQGIFVAVTLLILISATWLGLYLAKRITRPVQQLAEGARAIGAGRLDVRLEPETSDELGSLVDAFNLMAAELGTSRERVDRAQQELERKNVEVEGRRRYIETILDRVATGVISLDPAGRISTVNGAAERLLALGPGAVGRPAHDAFGRSDLVPLLPLVDEAGGAREGSVQEITLSRDDREIHLAAASTTLSDQAGAAEGAVLVLDDVTPLIRAQRVAAWRDVARRLAHEIRNPLTPIQLSAERLRRHFAAAPPQTATLVAECTDAIIVEVEALKGLVDEFAQFARLRGPRMVPTDLSRLADDVLKLYGGVLSEDRWAIRRDLTDGLPAVRLDAEQIRQVLINLLDNAVEALGGPAAPLRPDGSPPTIAVATRHDPAGGVVQLVVTDNGPGVPAADRDKLFMPYYSTKGRGSGLGLAIVRRIVAEHGGSIEAGDAHPAGTRFTIELPAA